MIWKTLIGDMSNEMYETRCAIDERLHQSTRAWDGLRLAIKQPDFTTYAK